MKDVGAEAALQDKCADFRHHVSSVGPTIKGIAGFAELVAGGKRNSAAVSVGCNVAPRGQSAPSRLQRHTIRLQRPNGGAGCILKAGKPAAKNIARPTRRNRQITVGLVIGHGNTAAAILDKAYHK